MAAQHEFSFNTWPSKSILVQKTCLDYSQTLRKHKVASTKMYQDFQTKSVILGEKGG